MIEVVGRRTSYGDGSYAGKATLIGQLNNDNNYDFKAWQLHDDELAILEFGQVDVDSVSTDIYVKATQFAELVATALVSDGTVTTYSAEASDGTNIQPSNYTAINNLLIRHSGNDSLFLRSDVADIATGLITFEDGIRVGTGNSHGTAGAATISFGEGSPTSDTYFIQYDGENLGGDANKLSITNSGGKTHATLTLDGNTKFHGPAYVTTQTDHGYVHIGPQNTSYCHFSTDMAKYYFNKRIVVDEGRVESYDEDLNLNRAGSATARLRITAGTTHSDQPLTVAGALSATTKSFVIDHPTKEGYKLRYGSLEGPENGVYVRGKLNGDSVIELPDYWTGLVDEDTITVQLTPSTRWQYLYVKTIKDNKVVVANSNPFSGKTDCFYTVYAERKDVKPFDVEYKDN